MTDLRDYALELGIETCVAFSADLLQPRNAIRRLCEQNRCGNYGNHYMCPPLIGSLDEMRGRLGRYTRGYLLRYGRALDVRNDLEGLRQTKLSFHRLVLLLEDRLSSLGYGDVWGMVGGDCSLCDPCSIHTSQPCPYPDQARTSLESIGVDVQEFLALFNLRSEFRPDRITWTGCLLFLDEGR